MIDFKGLIREEDVAWASLLMGLGETAFAPTGADDSRLRAMMSVESADFEACPGSGKTTMLVAKLAILAHRWPHRRHGICVLSHTNAARDEIGERLRYSPAGTALLRYPHFVGTIHSFVNEYLAVPWLRSKGVEIHCIDTAIALRRRFASLPRNIRFALERAEVSETTLIYSTADFSGQTRFGPTTATSHAIRDAARASYEQGYFCFDEMFVWAAEMLDQHPKAAEDLRQRFPLLFIDEAQDNSEEQAALLHRIFLAGERPVRRQRFGDSNQAIYANTQQKGARTDPFPGKVVHSIPRSHRFSQALADIVKGFGIEPQPLVGAGPSRAHVDAEPRPAALFLFDDASVANVLPCFGNHLIAQFDEETLARGRFVAVAGVHKPGGIGRLPGAMGDYAPHYDAARARKDATPSSFAEHLNMARRDSVGSDATQLLVNAVAAALLAAGELAGGDPVGLLRLSPHRRLTDRLREFPCHADYLELLGNVIASRGVLDETTWTRDCLPKAQAIALFLGRTPALKDEADAFLARYNMLTRVGEVVASGATENVFLYPEIAPRVRVRLGSIHSVKGETHTATLVLDTRFHGHHLIELKPWLMGVKSGGTTLTGPKGKPEREGVRMLGRLKLHYVAMTRPTHLLGLGMRADAFTAEELDHLRCRNWAIVDCREKDLV